MNDDVKAVTKKETGQVIDGRTRLQGIQYVHGASADLTFSNGATSTGTTLLQITAPSAIGVYGVSIPQNGIVFADGIHMTNGNTAAVTSVTLFYEGGGEA